MKSCFAIWRRSCGLWLLVGLLSVLMSGCNRHDLSFEDLRLRYRRTLLPPKVDRSDSLITARIAAADQAVEGYWNNMNRTPGRNYLWADSRDRFAEAQSLTMDYGRLEAMARAYYTLGSRYEGNDSLLREVIAGLDWMYQNRYNPGIPMYHNWWEWVIGVPMTLNNILVILYDDLTPQQWVNYLAAMDYYAPDVTFEGAATGANKIWQCGNMALRGILAQRPEQLQMAIDGLSTEFVYVSEKDGFYRDGSFVQHQWHPYNGGYGTSLLAHMASVIPLVQDSPWEVPQEYQQMLFEWVRNGYEPLLYRGAMMDMVRGREISRKTTSDRVAGHSVLVSMFKLSEIAPDAEKARLRSVIKAHMLADTCRDLLLDMPTYLVSEARALRDDKRVVPATTTTLNKVFGAMDRVVHVRPGFALGLAMSSARIENYETINGENLKAWYIGDGMTYLYDGDLRQFGEDFWPTVDAYRMPGTTVDTHKRKAETLPFAPGLLYADGYKSPETWVGGCSLFGEFGMAGMALKAFESTLQAKKSWFMVDDEIVCLGAGIVSRDHRTIETIVENRKLNDSLRYRFDLEGVPVLTHNGSLSTDHPKWVHFEGSDEGTSVGYYFLEPARVHLLRETRTGSWYEISQPYGDTTPIVKDYFTMWIDHGKNPHAATYAYVLLPGSNLEQTMLYARNPNVRVLANTPQVQAVKHRTEGVTGINFWEAGSLPQAGVRVSAPASVMLRETEEELWVGLSDPTHLQNEPVILELERVAESVLEDNPWITVLSMTPEVKLEVDLSGSLGQTLAVKLKK